MTPTIRRRAAAGLALLAVGGTAGAAGTIALDGHDSATTPAVSVTRATPAASTLDPAEIYRRSAPGVVQITVTSRSQNGFPFGGGGGRSQSTGTGFVIDRQGDIVTNQHVVDGAESVRVRFADGSTTSAKVLGTDPSTDVAVVRVDVSSSKLHPLTLGSSEGIRPGDPVVAIGGPFGLPDSITSGIVSATGRTIDAPNGTPITGAIQTDAAINHGNSGGPLIDAQGRVIGVTSQIDSESGGSDGVGFAVPVDTVKSVASRLAAGQKVRHGFLGVQVAPSTSPRGARVGAVDHGSAADRVGLKRGDVIVALDGKAVTGADDLSAGISSRQPGDKVQVTYVRAGSRHTVTATLGTRPSSSG